MTSTTRTSIYATFAGHNEATQEDLGADPAFSAAALEAIEETSADWKRDLLALRHGATTAETLLAKCLDGADDDRAEGWRDYVSALMVAA